MIKHVKVATITILQLQFYHPYTNFGRENIAKSSLYRKNFVCSKSYEDGRVVAGQLLW